MGKIDDPSEMGSRGREGGRGGGRGGEGREVGGCRA